VTNPQNTVLLNQTFHGRKFDEVHEKSIACLTTNREGSEWRRRTFRWKVAGERKTFSPPEHFGDDFVEV